MYFSNLKELGVILNLNDKINLRPNQRDLKKIHSLDDFFPGLDMAGFNAKVYVKNFFKDVVRVIVEGKYKEHVEMRTGPVNLNFLEDDGEFRKVMQKACEYVIHKSWQNTPQYIFILTKLGDEYIREMLHKYMFMRPKELQHFYFLYRKEDPDVFDIPIQFKKIYSKEKGCYEEWFPLSFERNDPPKQI